MTVTQTIGAGARWLLDKIVSMLAATGINPNALTFFGLLINLWAAVLFAAGEFRIAGGVMIFAGLFDMVDGRVARKQGRVTHFGAYFDSVIDRYSDLILYLGLLIYYARVNRFNYVILVGVAMAGSVMVSYARARAESLIRECKAGFWERPERIVLMIIGALSNKMAPALWLLAIFPNITVIHRIVHTWREMKAGRFVDLVPRAKPIHETDQQAKAEAEKPSTDKPAADQEKAEAEKAKDEVLRRRAEPSPQGGSL